MQGPCETGETGETLDNPSMVSVPLCTKLEMSDINQGNSPWASAIATLYHPPVRNEELRLSLLLAHSITNGEKSEKLRVATLNGRLPTSPGSLAHNRLSHTRPVRYETFLSNLRILRKTSNAALAALRHSHPFLTLAKRIGLEPKHIP